MKKKVFIIGPFPPPFSGTTIKNSILARYLQKQGQNVIRINTIGKSIKALVPLLRFTFSSNINLVISVSVNGRKILLPYAYIAKKIFGKRVILMPCGGTMPEELEAMGRIRSLVYYAACRSLDRILVESLTMEKKIKHILGATNIEVMFNFKPRPDNAPVYAKDRMVKIVYLGRLRRDKGIFILIQAVEELRERESLKITLDFYGDFLKQESDLEVEFRKKITNLAYIHHQGYIHPDKVNQTIRKYDIFAFPTLCETEGFPGALIDAAYAGLPVIATDLAYNSEIIKNGKTGLLCQPRNVSSMKNCIKELYYDSEKRRELGRNNWEQSIRYDPALAVKRIEEIFA